MANWVGYMVSINCSDTGTYQGQILSATNSNITITKAFRDGIPCGDDITILASKISNLKLIEKQTPGPEKEKSTIKIAKPIAKRIGRTASLSESSFINKVSTGAPNKSKPIDIQQLPERQQNGTETQSGSHKNSTPTKKDKNKSKWCQKWKDEQCFGSLDLSYSKDFDFEKNLALFDKRAIWDEINAHKPDVIKHTDQNRRFSKYRHDENVIATTPTVYRQITLPDLPSTPSTSSTSTRSYVTDDGLVVPSIPMTLRNRLWQAADRVGLGWERRVELLGRGTTEMVLQLVGGAHRLSPTNGHQQPRVVILCGANRQGAMGLNAARHLASHGVDTIVYIERSNLPSYVQHELSLYGLCNNRVANTVNQLPTSPVDLSIVALCDEISDGSNAYGGSGRGDTMGDLFAWVNSNRAPALAIDPSPTVGIGGFDPKYSILPALPLYHGNRNGKLYLCNLGIPDQVFADVGITYKSPFGAKFVIPLYPNET